MVGNPLNPPQAEPGSLGFLARTSRELGAEPDPGRALWILVSALRRHFEIDRAGVFAFDQTTNALHLVAGVNQVGAPEFATYSIPLDDEVTPLKRIARRELPCFFSTDVSREYPWVRWAPGVRAHVIVPIVAGDQFLGALAADNCFSDRPIPESVVEPLFIYAAMAASPLFSFFRQRERERIEIARRRICGDVLFAVTNGKIRLCDAREIEAEWPPLQDPIAIQRPEDIRSVREAVRKVGKDAGMEAARVEEFGLCACEAATNALVHGNGGAASLAYREDRLRIRVADEGHGIPAEDLHRATLVKGWSSRASMGLGFTIINESADQVLLSTGESGTTLIVEMGRRPAPVDLAHFQARLWADAAPL